MFRARPAGGASFLLTALLVSLVLGLFGGAAQADDTNPTPATASPTASDDSTARTVATTQLLGPTTAAPDYLVLRRGFGFVLNVASNDKCSGPCTYSMVSAPAGWKVTITTAGLMSISVPKAAATHRYPVYYRITDGPNVVQGQVTVAVTMDSYARSGLTFTHPYRKGYRYKIRTHILRTINSVPSGARIQVASWSFSSKLYRQALNRARNRGVIVQIVLSQRNRRDNSDYRTLRTMFGTQVTPNGSWVRKCSFSCRGGNSGTMHSKIFLFSQAYRTPYVVMTGSANLTDFAVNNQWNQMNTVTRNKAVYDQAVQIFNQMSADHPVSPPYVETHFSSQLWSYYYPRGAVTPANDFMLKALAPVHCTGATNAGAGGRTIVKIAMYAWYQERGKWLADRVRQLWQEGCQVQIVYAISSNPVKKRLYSPAGRGRIPMRQILLTNKNDEPIYYLHDKWVAITGHYGNDKSLSVSFQGSFNFSDLGFHSDEQFQMIGGRAAYDRFARDFKLLWTDRQARAPSPVSTIKNIERTAPGSPTLGTGTYQYMEAD